GQRVGYGTPKAAAGVAAYDAWARAASLTADGSAHVDVDGLGSVEITPDAVVVTETPREGWAVAREGETVALDLTLTDELIRAGLAREVVRLVQEARRASGFDVTDRVELAWRAEGELAEALREHSGTVAGEVLATSVHEGLDALPDEADHTSTELGLTFRLRRITT